MTPRTLTYSVTILFFTLLCYHFSSINTQSTAFHSALFTPLRRSCGSQSLLHKGQWVRKDRPLQSLEEVAATDNVDKLECHAVTKEETISRTLQVASYEWKPTSCSLSIDLHKLLMFALASPSGVLFAGDSLSQQHWNSLGLMYGVGPNELLSSSFNTVKFSRPPYVPLPKNTYGYYLNDNHPLFTKLLAEGRFSLNRLRSPVFTFFSNRHLFSSNALAANFPRQDENTPVSRAPNLYEPDSQNENWVTQIQDLLSAYSTQTLSAGTSENTQKTLLVLSAGPHFSFFRFTGLRKDRTEEGILDGYTKSVEELIESLQTSENADKLEIVYRTSPFMDSRCGSNATRWHDAPISDPLEAAPMDAYNYAWFTSFDQVWRNAKNIRILDIIYMTRLRPDAAKNYEKGDCLHKCISVWFDINKMLFAMLDL